MSLNYKLVDNNNVFDIFETQTEQIIKSFDDNTEARKFLRHLNLGGGFDGWTPSFFMYKFELNETAD
jgi:hypothetical protein